ncbi:hypothetical protein [Engelhardtia mirabilis]|uniref:Uncharacterized protein n=1 Tax=Engelhardtia mirabilis TaxID=2528011 RepID=A0A518BMJ5_9BACT|nr:hypothetical protein Pla133_32610 [Planctomycetes bacterium Pla133]QDV02493.1 hypothetical protein Pla86_32600 [Planctomycetes bacterium Pla86]
MLKRLKSESFAAGVERDEVERGPELLGVDLDEHRALVIAVLAEHRDEPGLAGPAA